MEHLLLVELYAFLIANYQLLNEHEYEVVGGEVLIDDWMIRSKNSSGQDDFDQGHEMVDEPEENENREKFIKAVKNAYG